MSGTTFWHRMVGQREGYTNLGILNVLTVLTDVLDGVVQLAEVEFETTGIDGAKDTLSVEEQAEVGEMLQAIVARITAYHTATMMAANVAHRVTLPDTDPWYLSAENASIIQESSLIDARANVESQLRNYLLNSETGRMTYEQFRTALGLSNE